MLVAKRSLHIKLEFIALTITALLFSVRVFSEPYSISHTGTIGPRTTHVDVNLGESFSVTMVMDNGGATAASQSWGGGDLQCLIFEFNDARDVILTVDLDAQPPSTVSGSVTTDAGGALIEIFSRVVDNTDFTTGYTASGFRGPNGEVRYYANDNNAFFYDFAGEVAATTKGLPMNTGDWSAPSPYAGDCVAEASAPSAPEASPPSAPGASAPSATAVPALPMGGLVILAGLAGLFGARKLRKAA